MNNRFLLATLCLVASCTAAAPKPTTYAAEQEVFVAINNATTCVVLFELDTAVVRLAPERCVRLLMRPERVSLPVAARLKLHEPGQCRVDAELSQIGQRGSVAVYALELKVRVSPGDSKLLRAYSAAVQDKAEEALLAWGREEREALMESYREFEAQVSKTRTAISVLRKEQLLLSADSDRQSFSASNAVSLLNELKADLLALDMEMEAGQGRRDAISEGIERARAEAKQKLQDDPMLAELEKIQALREEALQTAQARQESGTLTGGEMQAAQEKLAEAKVAVFRRREELTTAATGELLGELTRELALLEIGAREKQARYSALRDRMGNLANLIEENAPKAARADILSAELQELTESYTRLCRKNDEFERLMSRGEPIRLVTMQPESAPASTRPTGEDEF